MCGVFGITDAEQASKLAYLGLFALQHRGQESAGISSLYDGQIYTHRDSGLVSDVFKQETLEKLKGNAAIGHVRYSTAGGNIEANIQPIYARIGGVPVSLAHNGNIVNADAIRDQLEASGAILQGSADTEIILHLIAKSKKTTFLEKLLDSIEKLTGAFSVILLTPTHMYAIVDACGYRPLSLGKMPSQNQRQSPSYVIASETCAMDLVNADFIRDIAPGEVLCIDLSTGQTESHYFNLTAFQNVRMQRAKCIFEHVYFARPDSLVWGRSTHDSRFEMGIALAQNHPVEADMVIAIPDSGVPMAMGYAQKSGIPFRIGLIRNHYVGRTFIEPTQNVRNFRVRLKLNPIREIVKGKRLIVIDDSIVRGTTSRKIIELLREAGATEIHLRIASPPVKFPCFYGIDTPKRKELLAEKLSAVEMNEYLKSDSLEFLSENELLGVMGVSEWCTACFSGKYQDKTAQKLGCPEKLNEVSFP